mgnify:CR=1 FL=1
MVDLMNDVIDPFLDRIEDPYKMISNANNSEDNRICFLVQDASPFDGAVIQYTKFQLADKENNDESIDCKYEYEIIIPPHDLGHKISDEEGDNFERSLGEWVIDILQKQMEKKNASTQTSGPHYRTEYNEQRRRT